jgi:acyl carrier protein
MNSEILNKVITIAKTHFKKKTDVVYSETTHVIDDLGGDSLDAMEIVMLIEDEFSVIIPEEKLVDVKTLGLLAAVVEEQLTK